MTPRDPFGRPGWYGFGIIALLLILLPVACTVSQAARAQSPQPQAVQLTPEACGSLAQIVVRAAEARDMGAQHQRYAAYLARRFDENRLSETGRRIVLREIKLVFTSGLPVEQLELDVFTRCMTGPLGGEEI